MTDREHALRVVGLPGVLVLATRSQQALDAIAAEFAAVRLEERAAICAWIHAREGLWTVDEIERGDYLGAGGRAT